jgi:RNA polymerase sigma factor (sigma-70 family)
MARSPGDGVLRQLQQMLEAGGTPPDDGRLLEQFVAHRDEGAFAELVARHGPLVLGLCRRMLRDAHDADDVFQATFLVLARKAAAIRKPGSLSCFLHGVAYRLAVKARAEASQRRQHEQRAAPMSESKDADVSWAEVRSLIDEELERLPEALRLPLVLCYLEENTQEEAARRLSWPRGTLKRRLERGRERLRSRLARRGVTLGAGLFVAGLTRTESAVAVPTALRDTTVRAALLFTSPEHAASATRAALLAQGALNTMVTTRIKLVALAILLIGCATAAGLVLQPARKQADNKVESPGPPAGSAQKDRHGDALPQGATARLGTVRLRHSENISPVVFSPDGKRAMVGDREGNVVCWDVATGKEVRRLERAPGWLCSLALSADGKKLAAGEYYDRLFLWDVPTGKLVRRTQLPRPHENIRQLLFTPDGPTLAIRDSSSTILLWDVVDDRKLNELKVPVQHLHCMVVSPDGRTLASGGESDTHIRLWDIASGKEKLRIAGDRSIELCLAYSPDGKTLAVIGSTSWRVAFFDPGTGRKLRTSAEQYPGLSAIRYAPDGKSLAGIERGRICILDAASGKRLRTFDAVPRSMNGLAFSSNGKTIASFWTESAECAHAFDLWDAVGGQLLHSFAGHERGVTSLGFTADGATLFSSAWASDGVVLAWDAVTGEPRGHCGEYGSGYNGIALSPDGKLLAACGDRSLDLWDTATRKKVRSCQGQNFFLTRRVAWSDDGRFLVSSSHSDRSVHVWVAATGKERRVIPTQQDYPAEAALSPDGETVAVCGYRDGTIRLWSIATGKERGKLATPGREPGNDIEGVRPGHRLLYSMVYSVAFSADGSVLASAGEWGDMHLWAPATGRLLRRWETKGDWIAQLAFSDDGRTLVTGHNDHTVQLWEVATGKERACFVGHRGPVRSVAFSRDGRRIASGSEDTTVLVWDATGGAHPDARLSSEQLQTLWADLLAADAGRAHRAVWRLALAPGEAAPFLAERLRHLAREEAARQRKIGPLVADLDNEDFRAREKAAIELEKMGGLIEPALQKALQDQPSLESRRRIERILKKVAGWSGERLQALRALEALEHMVTPQARRCLDELARVESDVWITHEARAAARRSSP